MKAKLLLTAIAVFFLCSFASAQGYDIRTTSRNNLRAAPSLDGTFLETVPAGTVLHVVGRLNRWLRISRNGREVWMADWVGYIRVESSAGAAPQPASNAPAQVDNCCYVDRQCNSAQDWESGYWAFQNGQCAAPARSQPQQTSTQPVSSVPAQVDNCCFVDRQCHTPVDWENGYYAFRDGQCGAPGQAQPQASAQTASSVSGPIDNCCLVNRQCHSTDDWDQGFYAYLAGECPVAGGAHRVAWTPSMSAGVTRLLMNPSSDPFNNCCYMHHNTCHSDGDWRRGSRDYGNHVCLRPAPIPTRPQVEGPPHFIYWMDKAFELIERDAPDWLDYIYISGIRDIIMMPTPGGSGFANQSWTFLFGYEEGENPDGLPSYDQYYGMTGVLVHEACHSIQQRTYTQTATVENELTCVEAQLAVLKAIDPGHRWVDAIQGVLDNIYDPSTWWW